MAPSIVHLPNGHNLTVTPVFGGLYFKANDLSFHHASAFPPGWTIVINSEDSQTLDDENDADYHNRSGTTHSQRHRVIHRYKKPTLRNDHMFISSISNPSNNDFRPASSPTRQIAMMLWASLFWYFHQPEPEPQVTTKDSAKTTEAGKPKGDWRIHINKEGIFKGKLVLQKLERMGLITSEDSSVGADIDERAGDGWQEMFVSRQSFWQLDARIFLFSLAPAANSPHPGGGTPYTSRPSSPSGMSDRNSDITAEAIAKGLQITPQVSMTGQHGPFRSNSHLPTYYPPHPPQYAITNGLRHPIRPKPPRQNETFYTRFVPSIGQYLSFRVASQSSIPCTHKGPVSAPSLGVKQSISDSILPTIGSLTLSQTDTEYLHKWMNDSRVSHFWGENGPKEHQEQFLRTALKSRHSFPVIGCWDGKPFGYFEIYWVREDNLGRLLGGEVGMWDRGLHCLVGEDEFRGPHRVKVWLSALVHFCWLSDLRTEKVFMEPRVDNEK